MNYWQITKKGVAVKHAPTALIILDGFGHSSEKKYNAIAHAKKPMFDYLLTHFPHTSLNASGPAVGLPEGYIGNSEVGHITIGAGRVIPSAFLQLHESIISGTFLTNPLLINFLKQLAQTGKTLHILGLLSDAGVQGHLEVVCALIKAATQQNVKKIVIHAFLDGRDVAPQSAALFLTALQEYIQPYSQVSIGSITGRYYAMDRDQHWDRTEATYAMLTTQKEPQFTSWHNALEHYYAQSITDEFIPPTVLAPDCSLQNNDGVIFANFREDRARQLTACFIAPSTVPLPLKPVTLAFFISAIRYSQEFTNPVLLDTPPIKGTLKEILSTAGKTIFSIAETEKYAHVTYFFGGGQEKPFNHEIRMIIPSLPLQSYAQNPRMSAQKITDAILNSLRTNPCDFYLINYANADMVGHSGNLHATIQAIEYLDTQLTQLYEQIVVTMNGTLIITADHGNAELMFDEKIGQRHTAHTTNKVPFIWAKRDQERKKMDLPLYGLADIAPFILKHMGIAHHYTNT